MNKKLYAGLAILVVIVAVVVGIVVGKSGGNKNDTSSNPSSMNMDTNAVATSSVTIQNYMFSPMSIKVKVGTTVTWTNKDNVAHTITADSNSTDAPNSMNVNDGKSYSFTFKKAGTYTYHCTPHPYMHGTVEVTD